ncbi:hypothetical protein FIV00_02855 [Labrenzia sp. THAF82]|nr:hypothetical protein FIV00_02855 [Labrenzia sp. THAF82]
MCYLALGSMRTFDLLGVLYASGLEVFISTIYDCFFFQSNLTEEVASHAEGGKRPMPPVKRASVSTRAAEMPRNLGRRSSAAIMRL